MTNHFRIKKGLNIKIKGEAEKIILQDYIPDLFAISPSDFLGFNPKLEVEIGDIVKQGDSICHDKNYPEIKLTSPINGEIIEINRGEKRCLNEIIIKKIDNGNPKLFNIPNSENINENTVKDCLLKSGTWLYLKQRPFGTIANPNISPRDIFISFFDSSPLAADYDFTLQNKSAEINAALKKISLLSKNKLKLVFKENSILYNFIEEKNSYDIYFFNGPHPAGLPGTHINKIAPINKGEFVWTVNASDLPIIGNLFLNKQFYPERIFALCGSEINNPAYYKTLSNAILENILKEKVTNDNCRYISGNVLTGKNVSKYRYLNFFDNIFTVIPEGNNDNDIFGWLTPGFNKFSNNKAFIPNHLKFIKALTSLFNKNSENKDDYRITTNIHGGQRAFIVSGEYEKVCPLNIYPQLLIKSAIAKDIEKLEQLGIYEVLEEDLALCEFVCTSKINAQEIIRNIFVTILNDK